MDVLLQIVYTVLILGFLIVVHEFGHFFVARLCGITVLEFSIGMGPALFKKQGKGTLFAVRLFPVGGYCKMDGEDESSDNPGAFCNKSVLKRLAVVVSGALMNLIVAFIITAFVVIFSDALPSTIVAEFTENSVSSAVLCENDKIIKINGENVNIYTDISGAFSRAYDKNTLDITVIRDNAALELKDVHFPSEKISDSISSIIPDFLVYAENKTVGTVLYHTFYRMISYVKLMYQTIFDLFTGRASLDYVSGPVGTSKVISDAAKSGFSVLIQLVSLISINLFVMNLLPLPALDGGRIVFLLIELIFRKPVSQKVESIIHFIGLILLLGLMVVITFKDIFFPVI